MAASVTAYLDALLQRDRRRAVRHVVEMVEQGWSPVDVACEVIVAAQREVGDRWMRDEITVADEHVATGITEFVVAVLDGMVDRTPEPDAPVVVLATPQGEQHAMGVRIAGIALRGAGTDVRFVGASVPAEDLAELASAAGADWVGLGTSIATNVPSLLAAIDRLRATVPDARIAVGGAAAATPEVTDRVDAVVGDPRTFAREVVHRTAA